MIIKKWIHEHYNKSSFLFNYYWKLRDLRSTQTSFVSQIVLNNLNLAVNHVGHSIERQDLCFSIDPHNISNV